MNNEVDSEHLEMAQATGFSSRKGGILAGSVFYVAATALFSWIEYPRLELLASVQSLFFFPLIAGVAMARKKSEFLKGAWFALLTAFIATAVAVGCHGLIFSELRFRE